MFIIRAVISTILFLLVAFTGFVSAAPADLALRDTCNSGNVQCCNSVQSTSTPFIGQLLGFLGLPLSSAGSNVGLTCSPLGGFGGGSSCNQQTVCCEGNTFSGLIVLGCSPININIIL